MSDTTTIKYLDDTGLSHLTGKIEETYVKKSVGTVGQVLTTVEGDNGEPVVQWSDIQLPDDAETSKLQVLYGGSITINELSALDTTNIPTGFFYSVYNTKSGDVYSGNFTYESRTFKEGTFLKWNGAKWIYDVALEDSNFKASYLYKRSYGVYNLTNATGDDDWACIWQWRTTQMQKCGVTFVNKVVCCDSKKGFCCKFTVDSRSTNNENLPYSFINCEYLVPQTQGGSNYWNENVNDLRTFIRVTVDPNGTYRVYSRMFNDMNGMSGVDLIYPTWSVDEDGFQNPIAITGVIPWSEHSGTEITKINYGANGGSDNTKADLVDGKVPSSQLPSYVDDVLEGYLNDTVFYEVKTDNVYSKPYTGETGKIYVDVDTNKSYRWSGSAYVEISSSITITDTYSATGTDAVNGKAVASAISQITHPVTSVNGKTGAVTVDVPDTTDLFKTRGGTWLTDGDFNALTDNGVWMCNSDTKSVHRPSGSGVYGVLNVFRAIKGNTWDFIEQTYTDTTTAKQYFRTSSTAGSSWSTWVELADESQHKTYETINNSAIVKLGSYKYLTGTNDARYAGSMFSVTVRDNADVNAHGVLVVKFGRYSSDNSLVRANGCEFIRFGSIVAGASGVEFYVDTTDVTIPVIYAKFTKGGFNRCYITPIHNASRWTWFGTAVEDLPTSNVLQATEKSFASSGHTHSNYVPTDNTDYYKNDRQEVTATTDWDTLTAPGAYKVQIVTWGAADTYHSPNSVILDNNTSVYSYGTLSVFGMGPSSERRIMQIYYPHSSRAATPMLYRMRNGNVWNSWGKLTSAHASVRKRGLVTNETTTGNWYKIASFTLTAAYDDFTANLLVDSGFNNVRRHKGILSIRARTGATAGTSADVQCQYMIAPLEDISSADTFYNDWTRFYYTNDTTNGRVTYDLWLYVKTQYQSIGVTVLSEHNRTYNYVDKLVVYTNPSNGQPSGTGYTASTNMPLGNTADKATKDAAGNVISTTYVKKSGDSMSGTLSVNAGAANNWGEGIRINQANNGWAMLHLGGAANSTVGSEDGAWTIARRGAAGPTTGSVGDLIIENNNSAGTGLTLYKNGDNPKWNNKTLVTGSSVGSSVQPVYVSSTGAVTACAETLNPYYYLQLKTVSAGYWSKLATITCNPGLGVNSTYNPTESFMCFDVLLGANSSTTRIGGRLFFNNSAIYFKSEYCLNGTPSWWANKFGIVYDTSDATNAKIHLYGYHASSWGYIAIRRNHTMSRRGGDNCSIVYEGDVNIIRMVDGITIPSGLISSTMVADISQYLPLSGGTMTGAIVGKATSSSWIGARDNAAFKVDNITNAYIPTLDIKTTNGDWAIGQYSYTGFHDKLLFTYDTDTNYSAGTNASSAQVAFTNGGVVEATAYTVAQKCTIQYNATTDSMDFVW